MTVETDNPKRKTSAPPEPASAHAAAQNPVSFLWIIRLTFLGLLVYWTFLVLSPFVTIMLWTAILVIALDPAYQWLVKRLGGHTRIAAALLTLIVLAILIYPASWLAVSVVDTLRIIYERSDLSVLKTMTPPVSIKSWPLFGQELYDLWDYTLNNVASVLVKIAPQLKSLAGSFISIGANAGLETLGFLFSVVLAGILLPSSQAILAYVRSATRRLDPARGDHFLDLTGATVRAVARGVVGISVAQAFFAGVGFTLAGIPQASLLTFAVLLFGIVQIGAAIVIIPVVLWSWTLLDTTPAILFTCYMIPVNLLDNVAKPFVMGRGLPVPMVAILLGVIGGALAYGIPGIFLGPIVLAVVWQLFVAWTQEIEPAA